MGADASYTCELRYQLLVVIVTLAGAPVSAWTALRRLCYRSHDYRIVGEAGTMFLQCQSCGHRTIGLAFDAQTQRAQADARANRTARVAQPQLTTSDASPLRLRLG